MLIFHPTGQKVAKQPKSEQKALWQHRHPEAACAVTREGPHEMASGLFPTFHNVCDTSQKTPVPFRLDAIPSRPPSPPKRAPFAAYLKPATPPSPIHVTPGLEPKTCMKGLMREGCQPCLVPLPQTCRPERGSGRMSGGGDGGGRDPASGPVAQLRRLWSAQGTPTQCTVDTPLPLNVL